MKRRIFFFLWLVLCEVSLAQEKEQVRRVPTTGFSLMDGRVRVGGWAALLALDDSRDAEFLDLSHFNLYVGADLGERWRLFAEFDYHHLPVTHDTSTSEDTVMNRAYLEYKHSIPFKVRFGKFNTPAGLWQQMHWSITADTTRKPLIDERRYFASASVGLEMMGKRFSGPFEWNYSVFAADPDEEGNTMNFDSDRLSVGGDVNVIWNNRVRLGSFIQEYENLGTVFDPGKGDRVATFGYAEWHLIPSKILLRGEYLLLDRDKEEKVDGFYAKLRWVFRANAYANYRYDDADDLIGGDARRHRIHALTLGFQPHRRLKTRLEYASHRVVTDRGGPFETWSVWMGYHF